MKHLLKNIKKELNQHLFDYLILITAGISFLVSLNLFKGEKLSEFVILLVFIIFYIIWGVYHHLTNKSLHLKTVLEYILIAFIIVYFLKILIQP